MSQPLASKDAEHGYLEGRHYTEYVEEVKQLKRDQRHEEATELLERILTVVEAEFRATGAIVPPWYYEQAAIVHRKEKDYLAEIAVLQRYEDIRKRLGAPPNDLTERLVKAQSLALSQ